VLALYYIRRVCIGSGIASSASYIRVQGSGGYAIVVVYMLYVLVDRGSGVGRVSKARDYREYSYIYMLVQVVEGVV
jgi:hypothetical protein